MIRRLLAAAAVLALAAGCNLPPPPGPTPTPSSTPSASPSASPSVSPSPSPSVSPSVSPSASPTVTPSPTSTPAGFPNASTTGAAVETGLPAGPCTLAAGQTYVGRMFSCPTLQMASGSVVRNSVIAGYVRGNGLGFTIEDTTITKTGCDSGAPAVAYWGFTLRRVHIKGFNDGVRAEGPNVRVFDSLIENCFVNGGHADGLQVCPSSEGCGNLNDVSGLEFRHNTVTHPRADSTGAIFVMGGAPGSYRITDNLLQGYSVTVRLHAVGTFTGNRVVEDGGLHGEFIINDVCSPARAGMVWSDNWLVTLGTNYAIASTGAAVSC